jgi:hypothetical protein
MGRTTRTIQNFDGLAYVAIEGDGSGIDKIGTLLTVERIGPTDTVDADYGTNGGTPMAAPPSGAPYGTSGAWQNAGGAEVTATAYNPARQAWQPRDPPGLVAFMRTARQATCQSPG